MYKAEDRKRVNFMISKHLLVELDQLVPERKRSDFINDALEKAIIHYGRKKACEEMDKLAASHKIRMSTAEFMKLKNYGRL